MRSNKYEQLPFVPEVEWEEKESRDDLKYQRPSVPKRNVLVAVCIASVLAVLVVYFVGSLRDGQTSYGGNTISIDDSLKAMNFNGEPPKVPDDPSLKQYKNVYFKTPYVPLHDAETDQWLGATCSEVFDKWLNIAEAHTPVTPPREIPREQWDQYTLYGRIPVVPFYFNQVSTPQKRLWPGIDTQMEKSKDQIIKESTYGKQTTNLYNAMTYYKQHLEGKIGAVVGSERPWAELMSLKHGALAVTTVEYWPTEIDTKKYDMKWVHPIEMAKNWSSYNGTFDFVVSYSSIEHSGLGRYGDPLDPFGDLREMAKMHCLLKPGGIFFLGVPVGRDSLYWNAHRVYGTIRLPWLIKGFELLGVFESEKDESPAEGISLESFWSTSFMTQPVLVLKKV